MWSILPHQSSHLPSLQTRRIFSRNETKFAGSLSLLPPSPLIRKLRSSRCLETFDVVNSGGASLRPYTGIVAVPGKGMG